VKAQVKSQPIERSAKRKQRAILSAKGAFKAEGAFKTVDMTSLFHAHWSDVVTNPCQQIVRVHKRGHLVLSSLNRPSLISSSPSAPSWI